MLRVSVWYTKTVFEQYGYPTFTKKIEMEVNNLTRTKHSIFIWLVKLPVVSENLFCQWWSIATKRSLLQNKYLW